MRFTIRLGLVVPDLTLPTLDSQFILTAGAGCAAPAEGVLLSCGW